MNEPRILLDRLAAIGESLSKRDTALALIGLGSVGLDLDRLDRFSDLDFFVIVKPGAKGQYLDDLSWLTDIVPAAHHHILILNERQLYRTVKEYVDFYNCLRPHQGLQQHIPDPIVPGLQPTADGDSMQITSTAILGGLHYSYSRALNLR